MSDSLDDLSQLYIEARATLPSENRVCDACGKPNANTYPESGGRFHLDCQPPPFDVMDERRKQREALAEEDERRHRDLTESVWGAGGTGIPK